MESGGAINAVPGGSEVKIRGVSAPPAYSAQSNDFTVENQDPFYAAEIDTRNFLTGLEFA